MEGKPSTPPVPRRRRIEQGPRSGTGTSKPPTAVAAGSSLQWEGGAPTTGVLILSYRNHSPGHQPNLHSPHPRSRIHRGSPGSAGAGRPSLPRLLVYVERHLRSTPADGTLSLATSQKPGLMTACPPSGVLHPPRKRHEPRSRGGAVAGLVDAPTLMPRQRRSRLGDAGVGSVHGEQLKLELGLAQADAHGSVVEVHQLDDQDHVLTGIHLGLDAHLGVIQVDARRPWLCVD